MADPSPGDAQAEFRRMMALILVAAAALFAAALWYTAQFMPLSFAIIGTLGVGIFASVVLGCGLFAAAFFSNNSGLDQRVSNATHVAAPLHPNPSALPEGVVFQRRTMDFTAETLPGALLKDHNTKVGTWGLIRVLEGKLQYDIADDRRPPSSVVLVPGALPGIVEPTILHHISPIGPVRFHVEFLRDPSVAASPAIHHQPLQQG